MHEDKWQYIKRKSINDIYKIKPDALFITDFTNQDLIIDQIINRLHIKNIKIVKILNNKYINQKIFEKFNKDLILKKYFYRLLFNENFNFFTKRMGIFIRYTNCKKIKSKYPDAKFAGYDYKISTWKKIKKNYKYFEKLWLGYKFDDKIYDKNIKDQLNTISITQIEKELEIDSIWKDIIHVDRNLIYTPGKKYRYSLEQQVDDDTCIQIAKLNYTFVKNEIFNDFKPDIIILPNFGSIFHNILYHFAKIKKINCWMPTASKISNRVVLTNEKDYTLSNIFLNYDRYRPKSKSIEFARNYLDEFKSNYIKPIHLQKINLRTENIEYNFVKDLLNCHLDHLKIITKIEIV